MTCHVEPRRPLLQPVVQHRIGPGLPRLQPDELVCIVHVPFAVEAGEESALRVDGMLSQKGRTSCSRASRY